MNDIKSELHQRSHSRFQQALNDELGIISAQVTDAFMELCPQRQAIQRLVFFSSPSGERSVELQVQLINGQQTTPVKVLVKPAWIYLLC